MPPGQKTLKQSAISCSGERVQFAEKACGTRYAELVFLHMVGPAGHVVHFDASGARMVNALFLMLGWHRYGFHKKCIGTHYAELVFFHPLGSAGHIVRSDASGHETSMHYFSCSAGHERIPQKEHRDALC
jgi:hypothetical protein